MLQIYNSLTRKIEPFQPKGPNKIVTMYNCGPTVYNYCHIGNFRSFLMADLLRRTLELNGYEVKQIMNITDVGHMVEDASLDDCGEDKMIATLKKSQEKKKGKFDQQKATCFKSPWEVASYYSKAFLDDIASLNFRMPEKFPKATDHIEQMVVIIEDLLKKGFAYQAKDGTIYFDINSFPKYGQLSNNTLENLHAGAGGRVQASEMGAKKSPHDFSLWKTDDKHLMKWETSLGTGFPGWHIECTAMSMAYLGAEIDFHTGGEDNRFPHHECEIAQSEAHTGKQFVRYWLHAKHLMVEGKKMSKSDGSFYTVRELIDKGYHPRAIRWALMSAHYQSPLNFSLASLDTALLNIEKLVGIKEKFEITCDNSQNCKQNTETSFLKICDKTLADFKKALNSNLNFPSALAAVFAFVNEAKHRKGFSLVEAKKGLETLRTFDSVLGVVEDFEPAKKLSQLSEAEIESAIAQRNQARSNKDYAESDRIRKYLEDNGVIIKDGLEKTSWETKS